MDLDVTFRRLGEFDAGGRSRDLVDVERTRLLHRHLPQPRAEIGSLGDVADHGLLAPHLLEGGDEFLVVRIVERLEVLHTGIGACDVLAADTVDLVLGDRDGEHGLLRQVDTGCLELLVEGDVGAADHRGIDHVRLGQLDLVDHRVELGVTEREVLFAGHLATQLALDVLAGDLHRRARPDIVRADQIEALALLLLGDPVEAGKDLLRGFLSGIDDVLGLFETFVEGRVVEHTVILLHDGQHGLARGRGPAAHDGGDLVVDQ